MIDFNILKELMNSARDPLAGKPLDQVASFRRRSGSRRGLRNCRLFRHSFREDSYWVELHGNRIATIAKEDGDVIVTIDNVESFPTNLTADRLSSILGVPVFRSNNALRARLSNLKPGFTWRQIPPLVDGQKLRLGADTVTCINPEIVSETRTRILSGPAKPVRAYIRSIRKIGVVVSRVGGVTYKDMIEARHNRELQIAAEKNLDAGEVDYQLALGIIGRGYDFSHFYNDDSQMPFELLSKFLERGLRSLKHTLYTRRGVYEKYEYKFDNHFKV
jgi:hypothetical protein